MQEIFVTAFATLFVTIDPLGITPMFAALMAGATFRERLMVALRVVGVAGFILALFGLAGEQLIELVGVTMPAFRVGGGLMLFLIAVDMLFGQRTQRRKDHAAGAAEDPQVDDPSVFPLATPLTAGPGAMAAMTLLVTEHTGDALAQGMVFAAAAAVLVICLAAFLTTGLIERTVGRMGIMVMSRVFGVLLGALAVQFVLDGLREAGVLG